MEHVGIAAFDGHDPIPTTVEQLHSSVMELESEIQRLEDEQSRIESQILSHSEIEEVVDGAVERAVENCDAFESLEVRVSEADTNIEEMKEVSFDLHTRVSALESTVSKMLNALKHHLERLQDALPDEEDSDAW